MSKSRGRKATAFLGRTSRANKMGTEHKLFNELPDIHCELAQQTAPELVPSSSPRTGNRSRDGVALALGEPALAIGGRAIENVFNSPGHGPTASFAPSRGAGAIWRSTGRYAIPFVKVGRIVYYRKTDLDALLQRRTVKSGGEDDSR